MFDAGPTSNHRWDDSLCLLEYKRRPTETTAAEGLIPLLHDQLRLPFEGLMESLRRHFFY